MKTLSDLCSELRESISNEHIGEQHLSETVKLPNKGDSQRDGIASFSISGGK